MKVSQLREKWELVLHGKCPYCGAKDTHKFLKVYSWKNTLILRCNKCLKDFIVEIKLEPELKVFKLVETELNK